MTKEEIALEWARCALEDAKNKRLIDIRENLDNFLTLINLAARCDRTEITLDLALAHLQFVLDKAESEDACLLCGEVFADTSVRDLPDCPVPRARDFLKDPSRGADAVIHALNRKKV